jgi:GAF domain-containing protein
VDDDQRRAATLGGYGVLDSPNEPEFDAIVRAAAAELRVPMALISLSDEHRQWFKAKIGLKASETPLSVSFCTHAIRDSGVFEVEDARDDRRFRDNPLVTGQPNIRFYAGAPLTTSSGTRIGTLCVMDREARTALKPSQRERLAALADRVMEVLEERRRRGRTLGLTGRRRGASRVARLLHARQQAAHAGGLVVQVTDGSPHYGARLAQIIRGGALRPAQRPSSEMVIVRPAGCCQSNANRSPPDAPRALRLAA